MTFSGMTLGSLKKYDVNLLPESLITKESKENKNRSSVSRNDSNGVSWSAASGSRGSIDEGHDVDDNNDFPSTKKQKCILMLGNGEDEQEVAGIKNCNPFLVNGSLALHQFNANSAELNQELRTGLNASATDAQLAKEEEEIRKERKRKSNRESAKRSRIRRQQQCEELHKHMNIIRVENSSLTNMILRLSEECLELSNENNSIEDELIKMYGPESIADLMHLKPA